MANRSDTKYLKQQRRVWYYVRVIPPKYRPHFINEETGKSITTYKRTTGCEKLDDAIIQRNI